MSKQKARRSSPRPTLRPLFFVGLLIAGLSGLSAPAQQPQVATVTSKGAAVAAATSEVLAETSEIRKLPVLRQVKSGVQSRAEIEKMIVKNLDKDSTPEELRASELALKKLGLAPADFRLRSFIVGLLTEQVAGYYDPKTQEFYLADWIDLGGQKAVIAHELTHALQDQHFNLRRLEDWPDGDSDAELAAHALVEGDATLVMLQYVLRKPLRALAMLKAMGDSAGSASEQIDRAPRALRESLLFPYEQGREFATSVYRRGGWDAVSKAYTILPQSTEQILHPDKYVARESPQKVEMPDIARMLGKHWKRIDYDVNGEWSYYLILDEFLKSRDESKKAAAGWGGDRYALYEDARGGGVMLAQTTVWDTADDAREFFDAYAKRTKLRYKDARFSGGEQTSASFSAMPPGEVEGSVSARLKDNRVVILEGVPKGAKVNKLLKAIWR